VSGWGCHASLREKKQKTKAKQLTSRKLLLVSLPLRLKACSPSRNNIILIGVISKKDHNRGTPLTVYKIVYNSEKSVCLIVRIIFNTQYVQLNIDTFFFRWDFLCIFLSETFSHSVGT